MLHERHDAVVLGGPYVGVIEKQGPAGKGGVEQQLCLALAEQLFVQGINAHNAPSPLHRSVPC